VPNFRSGDNGQQVCRRQALHSNNPDIFWSVFQHPEKIHDHARESVQGGTSA
jgi:hypothetical protein